MREQFWRRIPLPRPLIFRLEYYINRGIICFFLSLPDYIAIGIARNITYFLSVLIGRLNRITADNLIQAGINIAPATVYKHFGAAFIHMAMSDRRMRLKTYRKYISFEHEHILQSAIRENRGVILVSGHFGNWEIGIAALALAGYPINLVAFPQINPYLNGLMMSYRLKNGVKVMYSHGAISRCQEVLNNKEVVIMLIDQTGREQGVLVDFFGRQAPAMWGPANLHLKTGALIVPFACVNQNQNSLDYRLTFSQPIKYQPTGNKDNDITAITQLYIKELEAFIRRHPEQWIWFHRRWKQYKITLR